MSHRLLTMLALAMGCVGCATHTEPRYAGTAAASVPGVMAPGQAIITQQQTPAFGTPSNIPSPIRVPVTDTPPAFGEPVDMDALYGYDGLGRQGMAEADPLKAVFNFERALEVNPFDPVALNNLAVAKAERGQFYEAMALLERASKLAPDNSAVIANLARLRGYVQSYATAGIEPAAAATRSSKMLPPAPPQFWGADVVVVDAPPSSRPVPIPPVLRSEDYASTECSRPAAGKKSQSKSTCQLAQ